MRSKTEKFRLYHDSDLLKRELTNPSTPSSPTPRAVVYTSKDNLLVVQMEPSSNPSVLVPGYVSKKGSERRINYSRVTPVPDEDQEDLINFLRLQGFTGSINFWRSETF